MENMLKVFGFCSGRSLAMGPKKGLPWPPSLVRCGSVLSRAVGLGLGVAALLVGPQALADEVGSIVWDDAAASLQGSGCIKDTNAFVLAGGADISVVFSSLGFSLSGQGPMAANRQCNMRLPASIPQGRYISTLDQTLLFGALKTPGSEAAFRLKARFFNQDVGSPQFTFGRGQSVNDPQRTERRQDRFAPGRPGPSGPWIGAWCKGDRPREGAFQGQIAVTGKRDSKTEDLVLFVDGLDLRFEIEAVLAACP